MFKVTVSLFRLTQVPFRVIKTPLKLLLAKAKSLVFRSYRGILVYNICLISISNSVSNGATNKSVLNIKSS